MNTRFASQVAPPVVGLRTPAADDRHHGRARHDLPPCSSAPSTQAVSSRPHHNCANAVLVKRLACVPYRPVSAWPPDEPYRIAFSEEYLVISMT